MILGIQLLPGQTLNPRRRRYAAHPICDQYHPEETAASIRFASGILRLITHRRNGPKAGAEVREEQCRHRHEPGFATSQLPLNSGLESGLFCSGLTVICGCIRTRRGEGPGRRASKADEAMTTARRFASAGFLIMPIRGLARPEPLEDLQVAVREQ
jgi:hypothetical protein